MWYPGVWLRFWGVSAGVVVRGNHSEGSCEVNRNV